MKIIKAEELTNSGQKGIAILKTHINNFETGKKHNALVFKVQNFSDSYNYMVYFDVWLYTLHQRDDTNVRGYYKLRLNFKNVTQFDHKPSRDDVVKEMI